MNESTKKATVKNAWLMAVADGRIQPEEQVWMRDLIAAIGVEQNTAEAWVDEMRHGDIEWQVVADRGEATKVLQLMTGLAAADQKLDHRERDALLGLGKALGFVYDEVRDIFRSAWGRDVLAAVLPPAVIDSDMVVISDDFDLLEPFLEAAGELPLSTVTLDQARGSPALLIAHACGERPETVERVRALRQRFPSAELVVVVHRHQAHHVSYALENGASRCMVEPIYPGELERLLAKM